MACKVFESALTGESMPAKVTEEALPPETLLADRKNMLYMGTTISTGRCRNCYCNRMKTELAKLQ